MPSGSPTVVDWLIRAAELPDVGVRVLDRDGAAAWASWAAIVGGARRLAGALRELGVRGGDRVALVFPTGLEFLDALFGTMLAGAVPVPLYPPAHLGRLDEYHTRTAGMLTDVGACLVLADRRVRRIAGETISRAAPQLGCLGVDDLAGGVAPALTWPPADLGLIQFSSGTTADPKGIMLTHRNYTANIDQSRGLVDCPEHYVSLLILPWDHSFCHTCGIYSMMKSGAAMASVELGRTPMETIRNLPGNIREVRPHLLLSVPSLAKNFR